ncbi:MAG: EAL domain-containing protein [Desulfuromonadaceae bacterium]|nr:EAL domain-containing protein [Desulfuromonadaceae bacterium]
METGASDKIATSLKTSKRIIQISFALMSLLVILAGFTFYHHQKSTLIVTAQKNLQLLSDLHSQQVSYWRSQQINLVKSITEQGDFLEAIEQLAQFPEKANSTLQKELVFLLNQQDYLALLITDAQANVLFFSGAIPDMENHIDPHEIRVCLEQHLPLFGKIHHNHPVPHLSVRDVSTSHIHMNLSVPLTSPGSNEPSYALVLIIDPRRFLTKLLSSDPIPTETGESVLVRQLGDEILRLTPTRFLDQRSDQTSTPPEGLQSPGKLILEGKTGKVIGYDYRLQPVFAYIQPVADSSWFIVSKIDRDEVLKPLQLKALLALTICLAAIGLLSIVVQLWWRQQKALFRADFYQAELENRLLSKRLDDLTRHANDIILLSDEHGQILDANERAVETYGKSLEELQSLSLFNLCNMESESCRQMWKRLEDEGSILIELDQRLESGKILPVEISARWIEQDNQRLLQAILRDISERRAAEERLSHQVYHDALTGLPNRLLIQEQLQHSIDKAKRNNTQAALLFLDLDRFKNINDTLGHIVGDKLLKILAERMRSSLRQSDLIGRFGGDEFLIIIEDIHSLADVVRPINKLSEKICQPMTVDGHELLVTSSVGICLTPSDSDDTDQLIRFADTAMYRAKERGRNNFQFFTLDMHHQAERRMNLENSLRNAVKRNELLLHYQPQVDLETGVIIGSEALVRWQHPELGLIPPDEFITLAEECGVIHEIGCWVLEQACCQNRRWQQQGFDSLRIAVNISPRQLQELRLVDTILDILDRCHYDSALLDLELTETLLMQDLDICVPQMQRLNESGIRLAIDDFGTGYSSLSHLHHFPLHKLKVDRTFICNIGSGDDGTIARSIVVLAHELKLEIIAEGIETPSHIDFLKSLGCRFGQGYLFSRPLPADEFEQLLHQRNRSES